MSEQDAVVTVPPPPRGPERVLPGALLSLLAIPAGIVVFAFVWNLGFVSAVVGFGVAAAAFFLYRLGSGGRISLVGAAVVSVVTLAGVVLAVLGARAFTLAQGLAVTYGLDVWQVLLAADFPARIAGVFGTPGYVGFLAQLGALPLVFAAIGCFTLLRGALIAERSAGAPTPVDPAT